MWLTNYFKILVILIILELSKQLRIPPGISVLHVEQEVDGDDTPALEAVLEADAVRHHLLQEEKRLVALNSADAATELNEVYAQLTAIEADKAPALASVILAGLGFAPEEQSRPTKTFSGGWRMRLALARALFAKPDLYVILKFSLLCYSLQIFFYILLFLPQVADRW